MKPTPRTRAAGPVDIREEVYARILDLTHLIPSISPWNVWDLPVHMWRVFARMTDEWIEQQRKAAGRG